MSPLLTGTQSELSRVVVSALGGGISASRVGQNQGAEAGLGDTGAGHQPPHLRAWLSPGGFSKISPVYILFKTHREPTEQVRPAFQTADTWDVENLWSLLGRVTHSHLSQWLGFHAAGLTDPDLAYPSQG